MIALASFGLACISVILFTIAAFGLSYIVGFSKISYPIRLRLDRPGRTYEWVLALMECASCSGFHWGWLAVVSGAAPEAFGHGFWAAIFCALYVAGANMLLAKITDLDG